MAEGVPSIGGALDDLTDEQLRAKLSKRQERNRQSARRSRENKKAHEQSLREQLKAVSSEIALLNEQILRAQSVSQYSAGLATALPSPGVPAPAGVHPRPEGPPAGGGMITPTEVENFAAAGEPPRELMDRFASWRLQTVQAVDKVRTLLTMGEPGLEALAPAVTEAFENLASLFTLREEALQQKLYLVLLNSEGFYSWEKPFLWMGCIHPSEWLRLSMVLMENRQMALQPEVKQPLDSWVEHLKAQEMQISENIRSTYSLLFAAISDVSSVLLSAAPEAVQAHKLKLQERLEEMAITHRQANQLWQQLIHFLRSPAVLPPPCQGQCLVALLEYLEALRSVNTLLVTIDAAG